VPKNTSVVTFRPFNLILFLYLSYMRLSFCIATVITSFRAGAICDLWVFEIMVSNVKRYNVCYH